MAALDIELKKQIVFSDWEENGYLYLNPKTLYLERSRTIPDEYFKHKNYVTDYNTGIIYTNSKLMKIGENLLCKHWQPLPPKQFPPIFNDITNQYSYYSSTGYTPSALNPFGYYGTLDLSLYTYFKHAYLCIDFFKGKGGDFEKGIFDNRFEKLRQRIFKDKSNIYLSKTENILADIKPYFDNTDSNIYEPDVMWMIIDILSEYKYDLQCWNIVNHFHQIKMEEDNGHINALGNMLLFNYGMDKNKPPYISQDLPNGKKEWVYTKNDQLVVSQDSPRKTLGIPLSTAYEIFRDGYKNNLSYTGYHDKVVDYVNEKELIPAGKRRIPHNGDV